MNQLPRILMITGQNPKNKIDFLNKIKMHIDNGTRLIQLRAKELDIKSYLELADQVGEICEGKAKLILNAPLDQIKLSSFDGVHLTSDILMKCTIRPLSSNYFISAACHNIQQLLHAKKIGLDFVTLSPVCKTQTHPEAIPLGWATFKRFCSQVELPIFALGGVNEENLDLVIQSGGYGIAAINSLWNKIS